VVVRYGRTVEPGFLPVYSVDTEEEAKRLLALACPKNLDGEYYARQLTEEQTLENLDVFSDHLHKCQQIISAKSRAKGVRLT
jgi:hypothetical protein